MSKSHRCEQKVLECYTIIYTIMDFNAWYSYQGTVSFNRPFIESYVYMQIDGRSQILTERNIFCVHSHTLLLSYGTGDYFSHSSYLIHLNWLVAWGNHGHIVVVSMRVLQVTPDTTRIFYCIFTAKSAYPFLGMHVVIVYRRMASRQSMCELAVFNITIFCLWFAGTDYYFDQTSHLLLFIS